VAVVVHVAVEAAAVGAGRPAGGPVSLGLGFWFFYEIGFAQS
jgi:hypothetical protein